MNSSPFWVFLLLAWGAFATPVARAQDVAVNPTGLRLDLQRGVTCLADDTLRERLQHWLRTWPDDPTYRLAVRGSAHDPRTVVLRLHRKTFSPERSPADSQSEQMIAERRFSPGPRACGDLHDAIAIAASMMVKAAYASTGASLTPGEAEPAEDEAPALPAPAPDEPATFADPLPHQDDPPTSSSEPARRPGPGRPKLSFVSAPRKRTPRGHPYLAAQPVLALDVGASLAGGAKLAAGYPLGAGFEARLGALSLLSRMSPLEDTSGRYRTKLIAGTIDVCRRFPTESVAEVRLCAGFLPTYLRAGGFDFASALEVSLFWPAISAELELALRLTRQTSLRLSLAPVYALREVSLVARDLEGSIVGSADLPRLGVMFGIGIGYEIFRQGSTPSGHESL